VAGATSGLLGLLVAARACDAPRADLARRL